MNNNTSIVDLIHPASIFYKKYNMNDRNIHPALIVGMTTTEKYINNKNYYIAISAYLSYIAQLTAHI